MSTMSMNKLIHRAFRRDLDRFVTALTALAPDDRQRVEGLAAAWENFDHQLTHHHEGEHEIAWPALERVGVSHQTIEQMDVEHEAMAEALDRTRTAMTALAANPGARRRDTALTEMRHLREVTVHHLDHEEQEIEPVFQAQGESAVIKEMSRRFARISPAEGGRFFAWLTDGAGPEERAALRQTVPTPVVKVLIAAFGRGYRKRVAPTWKSWGPTT